MRPGMAVSGESLDLGRSMSPPLRHVRFPTPRRLPAIPGYFFVMFIKFVNQKPLSLVLG